MTTIADLTAPASEFVLSWTLQEHPEAVVAVERVVAISDSAVTPYFWVSDGHAERFEGLLTDDPTVEAFAVLEAEEDERFYRARWTEKVRPLTYVLRDAEGTILHAVAKDGTWWIRALFPDDEDLSRFHDFCATYDISFDLDSIFSEHETPVITRYLTDPQRHILAVAHEMGYFEVPPGRRALGGRRPPRRLDTGGLEAAQARPGHARRCGVRGRRPPDWRPHKNGLSIRPVGSLPPRAR